jgi:hypothetical protein
MCFYNDDGDWSVSHEESEDRIADRVFKCCECSEEIAVGETYHYRYQQERDAGDCKRCENSECDCVDWSDDDADISHDCKCEEPDYGETWEGRTCLNCRKFLEGVKAHELAEGCREWESQPLPGGMTEQMCEFDSDDLRKYFDAAEKLHPDLQTSGYLNRLWVLMRGTVEAEK